MKVEVWSDVACPWCYIGKRRFDVALARFEHRDAVDVRYRSFELDPAAPAVRELAYLEHLMAKYRVPLAEADAMIDRMIEAGAQNGVVLRFDKAKPGNTFDAHRLLHLAAERGMQSEMKDKLLRATFTKGAAIADHGVLVEDYGGDVQSAQVSAKTGAGVGDLLDKVLLQAELLDLKANPDRNAQGIVIESRLDRGRGVVATILVQNGTLEVGDSFVAGVHSGRVRAMFDERDQRIDSVGPSEPVTILGFPGAPEVGDRMIVMDDEREAREIAQRRQQIAREHGHADSKAAVAAQNSQKKRKLGGGFAGQAKKKTANDGCARARSAGYQS